MRLVTASLGASLGHGDEKLSVIQYIPAGRNTVSAKVDGSPEVVDLVGCQRGAELLQASLEKRLRQNVKPIIDFDHQDTGPAAGKPKRFFWDDQEGIMLEVKLSRSGRAAVKGEDYEHFSPLCLIDGEGCPIGLHPERPAGALTNDPALRNIRKVAAKRETNSHPTMADTHDFTPLIQAGILTADQAKASNVVPVIAAAFAKRADSEKTLEAAKAQAEKERDEANKVLQAHRTSQADTVIKRAIECGRIGKKDEDGQKFWRGLILERGDEAIRQLEAKSAVAPGIATPVITPMADDKGGEQKTVQAQQAKKISARAREIQASKPGTPWGSAFQQATHELS